MIRQTKISRTILMAMSILLAAVVAAQENNPDPATRRPGVIAPAADLSGTYGDVVVEGDATYFASGVLLKPKSTRPWTADLIGGTAGGFTVINSARTKQLLTIFDNGNTVLRGGQTPLAVYGDSTPVGGFLVYDGASMGLPPGGVNVQITGPSVLLAGGLQLGLGGSSIINSVSSQPLYLNPWVNYDTIVGNSADATSGLKVVSRGASYFTGRLGVGTAAPLSQLHVVETDTGWPRGIILDHITQDGTAAFIMGRKARGTPAAPTIVSTGDNIMAITPGAYDGTSAYMSLTRMLFTVDGPVSAGNAPMAVRFTSGATSEIERMRITSAGNVGIGTATPNPAYLLDVAGNANFSGTVTGGNIKAKYQDVAEWVPTTERLAA